MKPADWLEMTQADARRRGLEPVVSLLEGLATSVQALRDAATRMDADDTVAAEAAGHARAAEAADGAGRAGGRHADHSTHTRLADQPRHAEHTARPGLTNAPEPPPPAGSLADVSLRLARGELKAERLVEDCLQQIKERQPALNAFITVTADQALAAARAADREMAGGRHRGALHGIPVSLKDLIDQAGLPTTAGSLVRKDHRAAHDAPVTARLRSAGAVFVGKTNLHEFAFGTTSDDSGFGAARNPIDPSRSPGGSSGGSAISVVTGMALATVGTDTGGSIRIPSAACGIVGLKPQWGEISADGVVPLSRQLDHVGPMARTVSDTWILYEVMLGAGVAPGATLHPSPVPALRVGVPRGYLFDRLDEDVERLVLGAIEQLASAGAQVVDVEIPHVADTPHVYLPLVLADAAEYHARTLEAQPGDYTPNVRFRLEMGRYVMGEDYIRAERLRARLSREVDAALADIDVMVLPALSIPAPPIGAATAPVKGGTEPVRAAMLRCTQLFNLTGHPALSLPCGLTRAGLPAGLQLVGPRRGTQRLLQHALAVERVLAAS